MRLLAEVGFSLSSGVCLITPDDGDLQGTQGEVQLDTIKDLSSDAECILKEKYMFSCVAKLCCFFYQTVDPRKLKNEKPSIAERVRMDEELFIKLNSFVL